MTVNTVNPTLKEVFARWNDVFSELEQQKEIVTPVNFGGEDPLALSWAAYNNWIAVQGIRFTPLSDIEPRDEDYSLAEQTRSYYRDKLAIKALKGTPLTKFQNALYGMLTGSEFMSDQLGMLYKLPYFYIEDQARDRVYAKTHSLAKFRTQGSHRTCTLTPIEKILVSRRGAERYEYWFHDVNQHGVCIVVAANNPIRSFVDCVWNKHGSTAIKGMWYAKFLNHNPEYCYWTINQPEIVF